MPGAGATWATVPMGAASGADLFWQLFVRPAGGSRWSLQTPPGIATNGAIVLAAAPGASGGTGGSGVQLIALGQDGTVSVTTGPAAAGTR